MDKSKLWEFSKSHDNGRRLKLKVIIPGTGAALEIAGPKTKLNSRALFFLMQNKTRLLEKSSASMNKTWFFEVEVYHPTC